MHIIQYSIVIQYKPANYACLEPCTIQLSFDRQFFKQNSRISLIEQCRGLAQYYCITCTIQLLFSIDQQTMHVWNHVQF